MPMRGPRSRPFSTTSPASCCRDTGTCLPQPDPIPAPASAGLPARDPSDQRGHDMKKTEHREATAGERVEDAVNTSSRPSDLKITDMRLAVVAANYDYPILKLDTNQGVYGLGEVRDAGHAENALQFKSVLVGENPCNVDMIFRHIKHFGNW